MRSKRSRLLPILASTGLAASILTAHGQWTGAGAGGSGTDFNNTSNWNGGTINGSFVNNTGSANITLSANASSTAGLTVGTSAGSSAITTIINGTAGGALEVLSLNGNVALNKSNGGSTISFTASAAASDSVTLTASSTSGLYVGQPLTGAGIRAGTYITAINGTTVTLSRPVSGVSQGTTISVAPNGLVLGSELQIDLGTSNRTFNPMAGSGSASQGVIVANSLISGTGGIVFDSQSAANGSLWLTNANNSFTGNVTITNGNLFFTSAGALGTGPSLQINGGGSNNSLIFMGTSAATISKNITATSNSQILTGVTSSSSNLTFTGNLVVSSGILTLQASGGPAGQTVNSFTGVISGPGTIQASGATWILTNSANTMNGSLNAASASFQFTNAGALGAASLSVAGGNSFTYTGSTAISLARNLTSSGIGGSFNNNSSGGASGITWSGNVASTNGTFTLGGSNTSAVNELSGVVSGAGNITVNAGTWILSNSTNTFTGALAANNAIIRFATPGSFGNGTAVSVNNGSLVYTGSTSVTLNQTLTTTNSGTLSNNSTGGSASAITLAGNISNSGNSLTLSGSNTSASNVLSGVISGAGTVTAASGTWTLSNATNTFTGGVFASGGTLRFTSSGALNASVGGAISNIEVNNGSLEYSGTGLTTITSRPVRIVNTGTIINNNSNAADRLVIASTVTNDAGNRTMVLTGSNTGINTISGNITETNSTNGILSITKNGAGTWRLSSSSNAFTGSIVVNGGLLQFDNAGSLGTGTNPITVNNGALGYSGAGNVTTSGRNILVVNTGNIRNDNTASSDRWLIANNVAAGDNGGRSLQLAGSNTGTNEISGVVSNGSSGGSLSIFKTGGGTWRLSNNSNSFTGAISGDGGTLEYTSVANAGVNSALGAGSSLTTNNYNLSFVGSTAQSSNRTITVANTGDLSANGSSANATLAFSGSVTIGSGNTLRLRGSNAGSNTISGTISGSGGNLQKTDTGKWILSAANTFNGTTSVSGGTLEVASANALGSTSSVSVTPGGTLAITTSNAVNDAAPVTLSGGTILRGSGVSETFGALSLSANSTINFGSGATGSLNFGAYSGTSFNLNVTNFAIGNVLTFKTNLTAFVGTSSFSFSNPIRSSWNNGTGTFTITAVPEPSAVVAAAALAGVLGIAAIRRNRQASRRA